MKKFICHLLIVWMMLFAGGANAHGISDLALEADHAGHVHAISVDTSVEASAGQANADEAGANSAEACGQSHCGHGHTTGLLTSPGSYVKTSSSTDAPLSSSRWASAAISDNIERPKWPVTTPAVVSLLS